MKGSHEGKPRSILLYTHYGQIEYFGASHVLNMFNLRKKNMKIRKLIPAFSLFLFQVSPFSPGQVSLRPQLAQLALAALEPLPLVVWVHLTWYGEEHNKKFRNGPRFWGKNVIKKRKQSDLKWPWKLGSQNFREKKHGKWIWPKQWSCCYHEKAYQAMFLQESSISSHKATIIWWWVPERLTCIQYTACCLIYIYIYIRIYVN